MYDVITFGTATRDAFLKSEEFKIVKDDRFVTGQAECVALGAKIEVPEIYFTTGGGATNTAVTFARQGLRTAVVAMVGRDVSGEEIIRGLETEDVETKFIQRTTSYATGYSILLLAPGGERTVLVHRGASEHLESHEIPWSELHARWFYLCSLAGNFELLERIIECAQRTQAKIAFNPGKGEIKDKERLIPLLKHIAVLNVNQEEASYLTGIPFAEEQAIFKKFDELVQGIAVMTKGPDGVAVSDGKTIYRAGNYPEKEVADRTGAGDAFGSGFVAGLIKKNSVDYAIRLGSANATSKVEHIGAKSGLLTEAQFEERFNGLVIQEEKL